MNSKIVVLAASAFGAAALAFSQQASAQAFGSAVFSSDRNCGAISPTTVCDGTLAGQQTVQSALTGGASSTANTVLTLADGSFANSSVSFNAFGLPAANGAAFAAGDERLSVTALGYQTYTYTGAVDTPFAITGSLHIDNSSTSGVADDFSNPNRPIFGGAFPDGATAQVILKIWDTSVLSCLDNTQDIFTTLAGGGACGVASLLAAGSTGQSLSGGETTLSATSSALNGGGPLMLTPGETILISASVQLAVNRGGFADASHTFTTAFENDIGTDVADLHSGESLLAVPEPGTWGLMLTGFFGLGSALRRRRAVVAA